MLLYPQHVIPVLNGLAGRAFSEIVEAGNDDQAAAAFIQSKTQVAIIRVCHMLQLRQRCHLRRLMRIIGRPA